MINYRLLLLLEKVLGQGKPTSGPNYSFFSPFCAHYKPKLEINLETIDGKNPWHCWISNARGKTIYTLFKKLKVQRSFFDELNSIVENSKIVFPKEKDIPQIELPSEFMPLSVLTNNLIKKPEIKHALQYLNNRRITATDIRRYNIGVCTGGEYKNMIIIPSYDYDGNLNYFVGRSMFTNSYIKYKNPNLSKDIIPFDMYINWDVPIILTEGVFDAIAIKLNAIPLLGKTISASLKEKIVKKRVSKIYIALDSDAIKDSIKMIKYFLNQGISVYHVDLQEKDPSEMGQSAFLEAYLTATPCSFNSLIRMELFA